MESGGREDSNNYITISTISITNEKLIFFIFPVMPSADFPAHIAFAQFKCHSRVKNHLSYTGITSSYKNIFISE